VEKALKFAREQRQLALRMHNIRLFVISNVYVTYYFIAVRARLSPFRLMPRQQKQFVKARRRLRRDLARIQPLKDNLVRFDGCKQLEAD